MDVPVICDDCDEYLGMTSVVEIRLTAFELHPHPRAKVAPEKALELRESHDAHKRTCPARSSRG